MRAYRCSVHSIGYDHARPAPEQNLRACIALSITAVEEHLRLTQYTIVETTSSE